MNTSTALVHSATMTLASIAADPWNAVRLPIPANADTALLSAALGAAKTCVLEAYGQFEAAYAGTLVHPDWRNDRNSPDNHEFYEQEWLDALDRHEELEHLLSSANGLASRSARQTNSLTDGAHWLVREVMASGDALP